MPIMRNEKLHPRVSESGFTSIELLMVLTIITIMSAVSIFYLVGHQELYKPDDQSLQLGDILQEARQRSLTQRETLRVEINLTDNIARLIDENRETTVDDDVVLKTLKLFPQEQVRVGDRASNVTANPPEPLPADTAVFVTSVYPSSISDSVCTLRFKSNGAVHNAGNDAVGSGSIATGATIHLWSSDPADANNADIARALTVIGATGTVRMWEWNFNSTETNKWNDSRRAGTYGG